MDWIERMNRAVGYLEENLMDGPDMKEAARLACCSEHHFVRMFPFLTEMSVGEYVRRRKLTLAAYELQSGPAKVVDVALKYGYDSPEAFSRAFQNQHGLTPTAARKPGARLRVHPRIAFQITVKGVAAVNVRLEEGSGFSVVGVEERVPTDEAFERVPKLWAGAAEAGLFGRLLALQSPAGSYPGGLLGVCADGGHGTRAEFRYILAAVSDRQPSDGMVRLELPPARWAVFEAEGDPGGIAELWKRLYTEWLPASGWELADLPAIENYLPPEENRNELWIAVVPKGETQNRTQE